MGRRLTRPRTAVVLIVVLVAVLIGAVVVFRPSADERALRDVIRALSQGDGDTAHTYLDGSLSVSDRELVRSAETDPLRFVSATRTGGVDGERRYDLRFRLGDEEYTRPVTVSEYESGQRSVSGLLGEVRLLDRTSRREVSVYSSYPPGRFQFRTSNRRQTVDYEGEGVVAGASGGAEVLMAGTVNAYGHHEAYQSVRHFIGECAIDGRNLADAPCPKIGKDASWSLRKWDVTDTSPAHYGGEATIAVFDDETSDESHEVTVGLYVDLTDDDEEVIG